MVMQNKKRKSFFTNATRWSVPAIFGALWVFTACNISGERVDEAFSEEIPPAAGAEAGRETMPLPGEVMGDLSSLPEEALTNDVKQGEEDEYIAQGYTQGISTKAAAGGVSFRAYKSQRGSTVSLPESTIATLCGDLDGCTLRMGMYNWDNTGRVASRDNLFFYNTVNRTWRAMNGDWYGADYNGTTEHIMESWACYFTDGYYYNWTNYGDGSIGFGLLSWNQYDAECWLTIIN
jgi:hypothetical protein